MLIKEKLLIYMRTLKTPLTAAMISKRFGCSYQTALKAMRDLVKDGAVKEVLVAGERKYVKGVKI